MATTKVDNFQKLRNVALYFTMTAALLYGLVWLVYGIVKGESLATNNLATVLLVATMAGGILMGVLYEIHLIRKK